MKDDKRIVMSLGERQNQVGLIVRAKTGIWWTTQAGGTACSHPEQEGFFLNIPDCPYPPKDMCDIDRFEKAIHETVCYVSGGQSAIDAADKVDAALREHMEYLELDREALDELEEAWIPVVIRPKAGDGWSSWLWGDYFRPGQLVGAKAILVTGNCD